MRKLMLLAVVCCLLSCSRDNENAFNISELNGSWTLTNISCFCGFSDPPNFNQTQITFDESTNELSVQNNGDVVYFRENGTYSYTEDATTITFEDGLSYTYSIEENMLQLVFVDEPNIADDEISFSFTANAQL